MSERNPTQALSRPARWRIATLVAVHLLIAAHVLHWMWSGTTLSSIQLSDAGRLAAEGVATAALIFFSILLVATAIFGRFFCAWGCHMLALQEACRLLLSRAGIRVKPVQSRFLWLVPFGLALYIFALPGLQRLLLGQPFPALRLELTSSHLWANLPGPAESAAAVLVGGLAMVYLLGSLSFCRYICPYGAVFFLADRLAPGRIRLVGECDGCAKCTAACTTATRVHEEVQRLGTVASPGCMRCFECVSACPRGSLAYGFGRPGLLAGSRAGLTRYALSFGEEAAMVSAFAASFFALHGLYGFFPLLVSLAVAFVAGYAAVLLLRLLGQPRVVLRGSVLKRAGKLSRPGVLVGAGAALLLLFCSHSLLIQYHQRRAAADLAELGFPVLRSSYSTGDRQVVADAAAHLVFCSRDGLVDTAEWNMQLAWLYRLDAKPRLIEARLRRAIDLDPSQAAAHFNLARELERQGRYAEAERAFADAVRLQPSLASLLPGHARRATAQ